MNILNVFSLIAVSIPLYGGTLDSPVGGWNYFSLNRHNDETHVSYPASPIDRGGLNRRTMIEGKLALLKKHRKPMLVANGNPMLLNTDEKGAYRRYYAFGGGSNSIEIIGYDGEKKQVQFYEADPDRVKAKMRIICSWDAPEAEVDLHIITPDGQHTFWANPRLKEGGGLDPDSVDGPGPEMFTTPTPLHGTYHIYVNYWGNLGQNGYNFDPKELKKPIITTNITLVFDENTPNEKRESFVVPLRRISDLTLVKSFRY